MSTGLVTTAGAAPALPQRSCPKVACSIALPTDGAGPSKSCCEESCLVEVARRECIVEGSHDLVDSGKTPVAARPTEQPCERHYRQTKERYGGILDNLGCICKVLILLGIESCCVLPSHASIRSKRSTTSCGAEDSKHGTKQCSTAALGKSVIPIQAKKLDDCSKKSYGSSNAPEMPMTAPTSKIEDCSKKSCCSGPILNMASGTAPEVALLEDNSCFDEGCCSNQIPQPASGLPVASAKTCCSSTETKERATQVLSIDVDDSCSKKSCCSNQKPQPAKDLPIASANTCCSGSKTEEKATQAFSIDVDDCSGTDCCTKSALEPVSLISVSKTDHFSPAAGCRRKVSSSSCASATKKKVQSLPATSNAIEAAATAFPTASFIGVDNIDIENGQFDVEHVVLSVQGMTCTGCEKKLYRSLGLLPAVSNIKTSLVLAQAEFELSKSTSVDTAGIIRTIEKMTGFTCMKLAQSGEELEFIMSGSVQNFVQKDLPFGVTDMTIVGKNTVRVTYQPRIVGARELLSNPFFPLAKLAPPSARARVASGRAHVRTSLLMTLLSALLTIPVLVLAWAPLPKHPNLYGAISLGLATVVQTVVAGPFYIGALKALVFSRMIEMDLLIVLSTTTAYCYSIVAYAYQVANKPLLTGEFFETSTLLVTLIMVGRTVSAFARQKAVESISVESLQKASALLVDPKTNQEEEIDARLLQYQDTFKVLPDTSIVTDGVVLFGESEVDESMVTGEAKLAAKKPGMSVVAGSINHSSTLIVRLTRLPSDNTIKAIGIMVDNAKLSKPKVQEIADRIASYLILIILAISSIIFLIWVVIGKVARHQSAATACIVAMTYSISALIVSCPCAIGLAVPMVVVIAGGVAAKHGLIFKSAETIEIARNVSQVIFDKTGTLTQGKLSVEVNEYPIGKADWLNPMILGLSTNSKHPVSAAVAAHLKALKIHPSKVEDVVSVVGNGIEATWNGSTVRAGNPHWLGCESLPLVRSILSRGLTMFCVSMGGELVAVFGLKDLLRPDALETIDKLQKRSIQVSILSGDNKEAVQSVASILGVPQSHVRFNCSPGDKQTYVKEMLASPKSVVIFCGDGTNDAVALAQASIGVHINEGTDIAQSAADAILLCPSLGGILVLIDLSAAFYRRVVFNFAWSFIYNVFAILLAAGAFPHARISPQYAGLGEIVSVLPVIAIGMQLRWARFQGRQ